MFEIIYRPELQEDGESFPIRFPREVKTVSRGEEITIEGTWIRPGRNGEISESEWEYIETTELGDSMITSGVLQRVNALADATVEDGLQGYSDADAKKLVAYTNDPDALKLEQTRERRSEVLAAIDIRIKKIQKELDRQRNNSLVERVY